MDDQPEDFDGLEQSKLIDLYIHARAKEGRFFTMEEAEQERALIKKVCRFT